MKNFFRSVAGKTVLFFAITLAAIVLAVGAASAVLAAADGLCGFDTRAAVSEYRSGRVWLNARGYLFSVIDGDPRWELPDFYELSAVSGNGEEICTTAGFAAASADPTYDSYTFYFVQDDRQGIWYNPGTEEYTVSVCVDSTRFHDRPEELIASLLADAEAARLPLIIAGAAALPVCIILFIVMMCVAGHRPKTDEIFPGTFARIPFDLLLAAVVLLFAFLLVVIFDTCDDEVLCAFASIAWSFAAFESFLGLSMAFATRVKLRTLIRTSLCYYVLLGLWKLARLLWRGLCFAGRGIRRGFTAIPLIPKTLLVVGLLTVLDFLSFVVAEDTGVRLLFFIFEIVILLPLLCWCAIQMKRLQKLGEDLAGGNLTATVNTERMLPEFRRHAEDLSSIREGMALSVDRQMKSERMKTELITNVSHDIKTPLTSIINYSDLIARESTENEKIREYSEVLTRQSAKLKRLIEDLVEASKAATGNLECDPVPCSAAVFLTQAAGEFADRLEAASLELVTSLPDEDLRILADSRRMWRVFDNLMNNVCKYSQAGTRVYLTLARMGDRAVITFRNTSRDALNISAEELMERFVRGDASRSTEGNGLGLSIAKSLTELQGGTFTLSIDGDLFKVLLSFPTIAEA